MELRAHHWGLAFVLALLLHLGFYLSLFFNPIGVAPSYRGGGAEEQGGDSADATGGVFVSLGQLGGHAGDAPAETVPTPEPEAPPVEPLPALAEAAVEEPTPTEPEPAAAPEEEVAPEPEPEPEPVAEAEPEPEEVPVEPSETVEEVPAPGSGTEGALDEPQPEEVEPPEVPVVSDAPPIPVRKPKPPEPKPNLELAERRLPAQGPKQATAQAPKVQPPKAQPPQPQAQPQAQPQPEGEQAAAASQPTSDTVNAAEFSFSASRQGDASGSEAGLVPRLNYEQRVLLWLKRHGGYPREAYRYKQEGVVLLEFAIDRSGKVLYYNILESSGYHLLDLAVKQMMKRSSPVPAMPSDIPNDKLRFTVPVRFVRT